jgi:hypothetical protein
MALFSPIFAALEQSGSRYVVVGGLASVLQGHARLTADIDLIVDLEPEAARRVVDALGRLGLKPRAPVDPADFARPERRQEWVTSKGMRVFSFFHPQTPLIEVDLFVEHPIDFESLWRDSEVMDLGDRSVRVASIPHLIELKRLAGRPQDLLDIEALGEIQRHRKSP